MEHMEMPTPCQKCGEIFDLEDGTGSTKWFPNTVICEKCGNEEEKEIEKDEEIEELKTKLSDAKFDVVEITEELIKLGALENKKTGIELIAQERREQIEKHQRTIEKDVDENMYYQLSKGASLLIDCEEREFEVPFKWNEELWFKMKAKNYKERLIIAGALIAAEIDRLQYK